MKVSLCGIRIRAENQSVTSFQSNFLHEYEHIRAIYGQFFTETNFFPKSLSVGEIDFGSVAL